MFEHALCVYPYRRELGRVGYCPPLGLEYVAAVLEPHCEDLDVIDLRRETKHTVDFLRPETDLVCFSINWDCEQEFIAAEISSVPAHIRVLVGGRHATEDPASWLDRFPNVELVVRGDGEEALEEICQGAELSEITGISHRGEDGVVHNENRVLGPVKQLYPNRSRRRYQYNLEVEWVSTGIGIDTLSASRGCPYRCTFCSFSLNPFGLKREYSQRSPESIVEELSKIDAPVVGFTDDLFTFDVDHVERICDLIIERKIRKKYLINARLEIARRPDILRKMEKAGFFLLMLGIESAHDKTLRSMRKGFNTAKVREYFEELSKSSMLLHGYFILGNIGESLEEMRATIPFARELGLDTIAISTLRIMPYSGLEQLVADSPGYHIAENGKIYSDHCSAKELRQLRRQLYREFFTLRQYMRMLYKGVRMAGPLAVIPFLLRLPLILLKMLFNTRRRSKRRRKAAAAERLPVLADEASTQCYQSLRR